MTVGPWLILTIKADPTSIPVGGNSTVTADLLRNSNNESVSGHVPEGIPVTFSTSNGTINPESGTLVKGSVKSIFTASNPGTATITSTVDNQAVSTQIQINKTSTQLKVNNVTGVNNTTVNLSATLTDSDSNPLKDKTVTFHINGSKYSATTDGSGVATVAYKISENTGNYNMTVTFAGDDEYMNSEGSGILRVDPSAGLYLKPTVNNNNPKVGESFVITYKLGNHGPDAAENVKITFKVPEGLEFTGVDVDNGSCNHDPVNRVVTWTLDSVPVGDPYLYLTVKALKGGKYTVVSKITSTTYNWNGGDDTSSNINVQSSSSSGSGSAVKAAGKTVPT